VQKYLSDSLQYKNFKISICFFSLQGNPVLLVPWMVYTLVFLIVNTTLYIVLAAAFFATGIGAVVGALFIIIAVIFVRK
jgi:hypothetical protein